MDVPNEVFEFFAFYAFWCLDEYSPDFINQYEVFIGDKCNSASDTMNSRVEYVRLYLLAEPTDDRTYDLDFAREDTHVETPRCYDDVKDKSIH